MFCSWGACVQLLLLDLLLLHPPAYRHCIFNHFGGPRGAQEVGATLYCCPYTPCHCTVVSCGELFVSFS